MVPKSHSEFTSAQRPHPMRGDDVGYQAKVAQEAPNSGNLVDDILNGRFEQHKHNQEVDDLLGSHIEDLDDCLDHLE